MPIWSRDVFVSALALSLLHSLWQGAVLGLLGVALHGRLQHAGPRIHCGVFSLLMLAVFAVWLGTFCILYGAASGASALAGGMPGAIVSAKIPAALSLSSVAPWSASLVRFLYPALVGCWALGVCLLSLRHLGGSLLLHRLCRTAIAPCPAEWLECADRLAARMEIRRKILLRCSSRIDVPCAFGLLRSCILLPLSAMAGLPPEQAEALIAHELAHIARNDILFNLIQVFIETAMFYHPAVRWLSLQIRLAREYHCDDLVVQVIGDRAVYARALLSLEEARTSLPRLALGVNGDGSHAGTRLVCRIRRVLGVSGPERSDTWARSVVALGAAIVALAAFHPVHADSPLLLAHNRLPAAKSGKSPHRGSNKVILRRKTVTAAFLVSRSEIELRHPRPVSGGLGHANRKPERHVSLRSTRRLLPSISYANVAARRHQGGPPKSLGGVAGAAGIVVKMSAMSSHFEVSPSIQLPKTLREPDNDTANREGDGSQGGAQIQINVFTQEKATGSTASLSVEENKQAFESGGFASDIAIQINGRPGRFGDLSPEQQQIHEAQKSLLGIMDGVPLMTEMDNVQSDPGESLQMQIIGVTHYGQDDRS